MSSLYPSSDWCMVSDDHSSKHPPPVGASVTAPHRIEPVDPSTQPPVSSHHVLYEGIDRLSLATLLDSSTSVRSLPLSYRDGVSLDENQQHYDFSFEREIVRLFLEKDEHLQLEKEKLAARVSERKTADEEEAREEEQRQREEEERQRLEREKREKEEREAEEARLQAIKEQQAREEEQRKLVDLERWLEEQTQKMEQADREKKAREERDRRELEELERERKILFLEGEMRRAKKLEEERQETEERQRRIEEEERMAREELDRERLMRLRKQANKQAQIREDLDRERLMRMREQVSERKQERIEFEQRMSAQKFGVADPTTPSPALDGLAASFPNVPGPTTGGCFVPSHAIARHPVPSASSVSSAQVFAVEEPPPYPGKIVQSAEMARDDGAVPILPDLPSTGLNPSPVLFRGNLSSAFNAYDAPASTAQAPPMNTAAAGVHGISPSVGYESTQQGLSSTSSQVPPMFMPNPASLEPFSQPTTLSPRETSLSPRHQFNPSGLPTAQNHAASVSPRGNSCVQTSPRVSPRTPSTFSISPREDSSGASISSPIRQSSMAGVSPAMALSGRDPSLNSQCTSAGNQFSFVPPVLPEPSHEEQREELRSYDFHAQHSSGREWVDPSLNIPFSDTIPASEQPQGAHARSASLGQAQSVQMPMVNVAVPFSAQGCSGGAWTDTTGLPNQIPMESEGGVGGEGIVERVNGGSDGSSFASHKLPSHASGPCQVERGDDSIPPILRQSALFQSLVERRHSQEVVADAIGMYGENSDPVTYYVREFEALRRMGYPERCIKKSLLLFNKDRERRLVFLTAFENLSAQGYSDNAIHQALELFNNDSPQAQTFLRNYRQMEGMGYSTDRIKEALLLNNNNMDLALQYLTES